MAIIKTEAIVLKCTNYRDKSKLVTLFTSSHGKLRFMAKGVRDVKSRWGGVLQSMAYLNVIFYFKENRTLHTLSNAEYAEIYRHIYDDYEKTGIGFEIINLIDKTTAENHENTELFNLTVRVLGQLDTATKNYVNLLFNFEFKVAKLLGIDVNPESMKKELFAKPRNYIENKTQNGYYFESNEDLTSGSRKEMLKDKPVRFKIPDLNVLNILCSGNPDEVMGLKLSKAEESALANFIKNHFHYYFETYDF